MNKLLIALTHPSIENNARGYTGKPIDEAKIG